MGHIAKGTENGMVKEAKRQRDPPNNNFNGANSDDEWWVEEP